jgi:hypothetical protein
MTDHQLSTRDLATRSESDDTDSSLETEQQPVDRTTGSSRPTGDQDSGFESSQADASRTPDPRANQPAGTQAADSGTVTAADGGEPFGSASAETRTQEAPSAAADHEPLFPSDQSEGFTTRWREIQTSFVDQPREAVTDADSLVADLMQRLAASFSQERERLEAQWDRGDDVSTEDLRVALTRYRSFFERLLSA